MIKEAQAVRADDIYEELLKWEKRNPELFAILKKPTTTIEWDEHGEGLAVQIGLSNSVGEDGLPGSREETCAFFQEMLDRVYGDNSLLPNTLFSDDVFIENVETAKQAKQITEDLVDFVSRKSKYNLLKEWEEENGNKTKDIAGMDIALSDKTTIAMHMQGKSYTASEEAIESLAKIYAPNAHYSACGIVYSSIEDPYLDMTIQDKSDAKGYGMGELFNHLTALKEELIVDRVNQWREYNYEAIEAFQNGLASVCISSDEEKGHDVVRVDTAKDSKGQSGVDAVQLLGLVNIRGNGQFEVDAVKDKKQGNGFVIFCKDGNAGKMQFALEEIQSLER